VVLTLVTWTPQSWFVLNFEGTGAGVVMKVMSPSSSSPWRFCEDMTVAVGDHCGTIYQLLNSGIDVCGKLPFRGIEVNLYVRRNASGGQQLMEPLVGALLVFTSIKLSRHF
jgi:hypothetical protein